MVKAVIFDCFGVLIQDSLKKLMDEVRQTNPALGRQLTDVLHANHRGLLSGDDASRQLAEGLGLTLEQYYGKLNDGEIKNDELLTYITSLKLSYKTGLLSNIGLGSLQKRFTAEEFSCYFDTVVLSGEVGYAKPEPEIYELTAERLGVRFDECIFTDDRQEFCDAARSVGMQAIHYDNFAQFKAELEGLLADAQ